MTDKLLPIQQLPGFVKDTDSGAILNTDIKGRQAYKERKKIMQAAADNNTRLDKLEGEAHTFTAQITGDFPKEAHPTLEQLVLKPGAMVMFIKNDSSGKKQYYNGRTAKIHSISGEEINLTFLDDQSSFQPSREIWENNKYALSEDGKELNQQTAGTFSQFPLRLAWAITIHKSQGLTFDKAVIDVGAAFAHGQTYVALSRCRNLEGMVLREKVQQRNIITDPAVFSFMAKNSQKRPEITELEKSIKESDKQLIKSCFNFLAFNIPLQQLTAIFNNSASPATLTLSNQSAALSELTKKKINQVGQLFIQWEMNGYSGLNEQFKLRLKKAAGYFIPQLNELSVGLLSIHEQTENVPFHPD
ncbi:MAG: hypothetical protein EOP48_25945, partial [Sphingobacteriales bacterium]